MTNVANGAGPAYLAPDWRYAADAWVGANALIYVVYETAPVYASDGVTIVMPGVPQNLAGASVVGTLSYQSRGAPAPTSQPVMPTPLGAVLDPDKGIISLSLPAAQTIFPRQSFADWGDPTKARLIVQPRLLDAGGNPVTVGLQQLFVF